MRDGLNLHQIQRILGLKCVTNGTKAIQPALIKVAMLMLVDPGGTMAEIVAAMPAARQQLIERGVIADGADAADTIASFPSGRPRVLRTA